MCRFPAIPHLVLRRSSLRVCSKINSDFAGGCLAVGLGASDEHTRQRSVRSEQRRQTAKQPQPSGAGRRLAICFVARRSQPTGGDAPSSRLASGQAALPPKSEVIFEQTLSPPIGNQSLALFVAMAMLFGASGRAFAASTNVTVVPGLRFSPSTVTIHAGDSVTWSG